MAAVDFYFDFISPYSYLAWCQLPTLAAKHGRVLTPRPVLFAAVLNALGTRGPAEVPPRRAYTVKDLVRRAHAVGVPLTLPPSHPFNPLLALRIVAQPMDERRRAQLITALYDAVWKTGAGAETEAQVTRALAGAELSDTEIAALVARAGEAEAKAAVRAHTEAFLAAGGFGVPTVIVDGELFFGSDSLPHLDAFLRGEDPVRGEEARELLSRWRDLPATATRTPSRGGG